MKIISHRGNIYGSDPKKENTTDAIILALSLGFDVEVDIWLKDEKYCLGHDAPGIYVTKDFLLNEKLWCHAKNIDALSSMLKDNIHCFWHQKDHFTLTSKNFIWTYPGMPVTGSSILVTNTITKYPCYGICTDYPIKLKNETDS
jgi:glycerophosphoryl diester phosphodiesterase